MRKGIYLALLTTLVSGFSIFANKIFVSGADPLAFTTVRNIVVAGILTTILLRSRKSLQELKSLKRNDWLRLALIGTLGGGVAFALFFVGLSKIGAIQGNLIHKTLFIWVAFMAVPFLGERLNKIQLVGYAGIFLATFVLGGPANFVFNKGSLLVLAATLLWALENVIAKVALKNISSLVVGWARMVIGALVLTLITIGLGKGQMLFSPKTLAFMPLMVSSGFLSIYVLSWYAALKRLPATVATVVLVLAPMITTFLTGVFISHTAIPNSQLISFLVMTVGVGLTLVLKQIHIKQYLRFPLSRE